MKICDEIIIEEGLSQASIDKYRTTVRGIMLNEKNQVLMAYSSLFDDYTFPGGGIKGNESEKDTLMRELKEEIGALHVEIIRPIASIKEIKYSIRGTNEVFLQTSNYYQVLIHTFGDPDLVGRENHHGLVATWVNIDDAIKKNQEVMNDRIHQQKGLKTVMKREIQILKLLKEIIYESI